MKEIIRPKSNKKDRFFFQKKSLIFSRDRGNNFLKYYITRFNWNNSELVF